MRGNWISTLFLFFIFSITNTNAQFILNGEATPLDESCYLLTPEVNGKAGSIWAEKINLENSFDVILDLSFGCKDVDGADGIVFALQPISTTLGGPGGGIGFTSIPIALGIEMDTYQNFHISDPVYDHIAIITNGSVDHASSTNLAGPIQADLFSPNIEDCEYHTLRVSWDAPTQFLNVYFDCEERLSYTGDIINDIFGGDPNVYWGLTSATGGLNNRHVVCFQFTTFLDALEDIPLCIGGSYQLNAKKGFTYEWSPGNTLNDSTIANPIATPEVTTLYTVKITDNCDQVFYDDILVEVVDDPVSFELGNDTTLCGGQLLTLDITTPDVDYQWSSGEHMPSIDITNSGYYAVTITKDSCLATDQIDVEFIPLPQVDIGNDTTLCLDASLFFDVQFPYADYLWQDGSTDSIFTINESGFYTIQVSNPCGLAFDQIEVAYEDCQEIFIPNIFSPNGDKINDLFMMQDGGDVINIEQLIIFDRWGNQLFEATNFLPNDSQYGWNGKFKGKRMPEGVYIYSAIVHFKDQSSSFFSGDVTLIY